MNPANNSKSNTTSVQMSKPPLPSVSGSSVAPTTPSVDKEHERLRVISNEVAQEITPEVEIPKELEMVGVTKIREAIELPLDVKKLGVAPVGPSAPLTTTTILPQIVLPISDQNVLVGLHAKVTNALRWLAVWCFRKLKKAHIALKVIHGKIIRVKVQ